MYTTRNYRTKSALKLAVANAQRVQLFNPAAEETGILPPTDGICYVEGPHAPEKHRWYARVLVEAGRVVKVLA